MPLSRDDLKAYLKLRKYSNAITVRGFQRLMGFSSPGKAQNVLNRLERYGLIERNEFGEYIVKRDLPPELSMYIVFKGYIAPRALIFTMYITVTVVVYIVLSKPPIHIVTLLSALAIPYWIELVNSIKNLDKIFKSD